MLIARFNGLFLLVHSSNETSIIALNPNGADPQMPVHQPTLEVSRFALQPGSARPNGVHRPFKASWDLFGSVGTIRRSQTQPTGPASFSDEALHKEVPDDPNGEEAWKDLWWIPQMREVPGAGPLSGNWQNSPVIGARIDLYGGEIGGGTPREDDMKNTRWRFADRQRQAFTDCFEYVVTDGTEFEVVLNGGRTIRVRPDPREPGNTTVEMEFFNFPMIEALEHQIDHSSRTGDVANSVLPPIVAHHLAAAYDLLEPAPANREVPQTVQRVQIFLQESPSCIPGRISG
jgi:hypothetical protein